MLCLLSVLVILALTTSTTTAAPCSVPTFKVNNGIPKTIVYDDAPQLATTGATMGCLSLPAAQCTKSELVLTTSYTSVSPYINYVTWQPFEATGLPNFANASRSVARTRLVGAAPLSVPTAPVALTVADLDNNGWNDVISGGQSGIHAFLSLGKAEAAPYGYAQAVLTIPPTGSYATDGAFFPNIGYGTYFNPTLTDVSGDGLLDIAMYAANGAAVWYENRNGTFGAARPIVGVSQNYQGASAWDQFTADPYADLCIDNDPYLLCISNTNGGVSWTLPPYIYMAAGGSNIYYFASGRINGDALADIVLSLQSPPNTHQLMYLRNLGSWSFAAPSVLSAGADVYMPRVMHLNGDGLGDIVSVVNNGLQILMGVDGLSFAVPQLPGTQMTSTIGRTSCDIDGDGDTDILLGLIGNQLGNPAFKVYLNLNGVGTSWLEFPVFGDYFRQTTVSRIDLVCVDVSGDGLPDVVLNENYGRLVAVRNLGNGRNFSAPFFLFSSARTNYNALLAASFGKVLPSDPLVSFVAVNLEFLTLSVCKIDVVPVYPVFNQTVLAVTADTTYAIAPADYDLDGDTDVLGSTFAGDVRLYTQTAPGTFERTIVLWLQPFSSRSIVTAQLDGLYGPDAVIPVLQTNFVWVLLRNATGFVGTRLTAPSFSEAGVPSLADINGDGVRDLTLPMHASGAVFWYRGYGNGSFALQTPRTIMAPLTLTPPVSVELVDVNNDGLRDVLALTNINYGPYGSIVVMFATGPNGTAWSLPSFVDSNAAVMAVAMADVDGSGKQLITADVSTFNFLRPRLDSPSAFEESRQVALSGLGATELRVADMNSDGYLDFVTASGNPPLNQPVVVLNREGDMAHLKQIGVGTQPLIPEPLIVIPADCNSDGSLDVVSVASSTGTMVWYRNDGADEPTFLFGGTIPTSINNVYSLLAFDADGDGDMDLFAGPLNGWSYLYNNSDGLGSYVPQTVAFLSPSSPSADAVDLNSDGALDILVGAGYVYVHWYENGHPSGSIDWAQHILNADTPWSSVGSNLRGADITGDGIVDIVAAANVNYVSSLGLGIFVGLDGLGNFSSRILVLSNFQRGVGSFALHDFDGNGLLDFLVIGWYMPHYLITPSSWILYNQGFNGTELVVTTSVMVRPSSLAVLYAQATGFQRLFIADLNYDGAPDALAASGNYGTGTAGVHFSAANTFWVGRPGRVITVDVVACGYTMGCVNQAITTASSCNGDTVLLPAGTYRGCPQLKHIGISQSIHVQGAGNAVVIDCGNETDFSAGSLGFRVLGGAKVTITGIAFRNLHSSKFKFGGSALQVSGGSTVLLDHVTFTNCIAPTSLLTSVRNPSLGFGGAALLEDSSSLTMVDCAFFGNTAGYSGGALAVIGNGFTLSINRTVFANSFATRDGGAIMIETSSPSLSKVLIQNCNFTGSRIVETPAGHASGGDIGTSSYAGTLRLTIRGSTLSGASATWNGGSLSVFAGGSAEVTVEINGTTFVDASSEADGGGLAFAQQDDAELAVTLAGSAVVRGHARGVGGGIAFSALRGAVAAPVATLRLSAGSSVVGCKADLDGGGLALFSRLAPSEPVALAGGAISASIDSGSVLAANGARRMGGAVAAAGKVTLSLSGAVVQDNTARYGAVVAFYGLADALAKVPQNVQSLHQLPAAPGALSGCGALSLTTVTASTVTNNHAAYGTVFACEAAVLLDSQLAFTGNSGTSAGGLFATCLPGLDCTVGNPCCSATSAALLSAPWIETTPAFVAAYLAPAAPASIVAALTTSVQAGYGPLVATPPVRMDWAVIGGVVQSAPVVPISTGVALGRAVVALRDALAQVVVDPAVSISVLRVGPNANMFVLTGGSRTLLLGGQSVDFSSVGVAAQSQSGIGVTAQIRFALDDSPFPATSALGLALQITVPVVLSECQPGYGVAEEDAEAGALVCSICPVGSFANVTSLKACISCEGVSLNPNAGAIKCLACPTGTRFVATNQDITATDAKLTCECAFGFYSPQGLALVLDTCSICTEGGICEGGAAAPFCGPGYYLPRSSNTTNPATGVKSYQCAACPVGGSCPGGRTNDHPLPLPGYFETTEPGAQAVVFTACPRPGACVGGLAVCSAGSSGYLCNVCRPGYYTATNGSCTPCSKYAWMLIVVLALLVIGIGALLFFFVRWSMTRSFTGVGGALKNLRTRSHRVPKVISMGVLFLQAVSVLNSANLQWSRVARSAMSWTSFASINLRLFASECQVSSYFVEYALLAFAPIGFGCIVGAVVITMRNRIPPGFRIATLDRTLCFFAPLFYLPICSNTLAFFDCTNVGRGRYILDVNPSFQCYTQQWWRVFVIAFCALLLYVAGIPLYLSYRLFKLRREFNTPTALFRAGNLYDACRRPYFWYEITLLLKRLGLVMVTMMTSNSALVLLLGLALVLISSLVFQARSRPYFLPLHNEIEFVLGIAASLLLLVGYFSVASQKGTPTFRVASDIFAVVIMLAACVYLGVSFTREMYAIKLSRARGHSSESATVLHVRGLLTKVLDESYLEVGSDTYEAAMRLVTERQRAAEVAEASGKMDRMLNNGAGMDDVDVFATEAALDGTDAVPMGSMSGSLMLGVPMASFSMPPQESPLQPPSMPPPAPPPMPVLPPPPPGPPPAGVPGGVPGGSEQSALLDASSD